MNFKKLSLALCALTLFYGQTAYSMNWIFKESASFVNLKNNTDPGKQKENSAVFTTLATACKISRDQNGAGVLEKCHKLANPETANKHLHALIEHGIGGADKLKNPTNTQIDHLALVLATRILQIDPEKYHDGIANLVCGANKGLTPQHFDALMRAYEKIWQAASADNNQNLVRSMKDLLVELSLEMPTESPTCPTRIDVRNKLKDLFIKELDVEYLKNLYTKHISSNSEYIGTVKNMVSKNPNLKLPADWLERCHSETVKEQLKAALQNNDSFALNLLEDKQGSRALEEILSNSQEARSLWKALDELLKNKTDISPILKKLKSLTYFERTEYIPLLQKPEIVQIAKTAIYPDSELIHLFGNGFVGTKESAKRSKIGRRVSFLDKPEIIAKSENGKHEVPDELPVQPITIPSAPELGSSLIDDSAMRIVAKKAKNIPLSDSELEALGKYIRPHLDSQDANIYTKFAPITTHDWNDSELDKIVGSNPDNKKKYQSFRNQIARQITADSVKKGIVAPCVLELEKKDTVHETQVTQETVPAEKAIIPSSPTVTENQPENGFERYKRFDVEKTDEEKNKQKEALSAEVENGVSIGTTHNQPEINKHAPQIYKPVGLKPFNDAALLAVLRLDNPEESVSPIESGASSSANPVSAVQDNKPEEPLFLPNPSQENKPESQEIVFRQNVPAEQVPIILWADKSEAQLQENIKTALNEEHLQQILGISDITKPLPVLKNKASVNLLQKIITACIDVKNTLLPTEVFKQEALDTALYKLCFDAENIFEVPANGIIDPLSSNAARLITDAFKPALDLAQWNAGSREIVFGLLGKNNLNGFLKNHAQNTDKLDISPFMQAAKEFIDRDKWYITKLYERNKRTFWTLLGLGTVGGLSWMTLKYKDWQPHANSWFWEPYAARGAQNIAHTLSPLAQLSVAQRFGFGQPRQALGAIQ